MSGAAAGRSAGAQGDKGRIEATKVKRYRPGQVPEWMKTEDQDVEAIPLARQPADQKQTGVVEDLATAGVRRTGIAAPVIVKKSDDPRLARLAAATGPVDRDAALRERHRYRGEEEEEGEEDTRAAERGIAAPQIVRRRERPPSSSEEEEEKDKKEKDTRPETTRHAGKSDAEEEEEEDEEDAIAARRAVLRARLQEEEQAAAAAAAAAGKLKNGEEEEEGSSEYETDSEEDDSYDDDNHFGGHRPLAKPVFVPRTNRETIAERTALEKEAEEEAERQRLRLEQRKLETKELVAARLAEEEAQEAAAAAGPKGAEDILTDDEAVDENEEYQLWRSREMQRIGRDKEEREREIRDADEKERWKALSEEERIAYLQAHPKNTEGGGDGGDNKKKKQYGFLQKYYHRGAFFQTEATWKHEAAPLAGVATERDFSAPTGEDVFKKESLPEVMQVKNFGRRGRSKWTHLAAEDTTDLNAMPWAQNPAVRKKVEARMAGTEQVFTKPKNTKT